jgi:MscS family membrane protein
MKQILSYVILDNSLDRWLKFVVLILLAIILKKYISVVLGKITYRPFRKFSNENETQKFTELLSKPFQFLVLFITVYYAFKTLHYPTNLELRNEDFDLKIIFNDILKTAGAFAITWIVLRIVDFLSFVFYQKYSSHDSVVDEQIVPFIKDSSKVVICIVSIIIVLSAIYKLNVASIIAGIGIGGLALALAAKESLENLFGSFTIFLDKPFHVGDTIQVGNVTGIVERVGFRSTRIRTDNKTFVTMPNKQMVDTVLDNITERTHRKVEFKIYLQQTTSKQQLSTILSKIKIELAKQEIIEADFTVIFNNINIGSFEILISYLVKDADLKTFNEIKESINFYILELLQSEKVEMVNTDFVLNNTVKIK